MQQMLVHVHMFLSRFESWLACRLVVEVAYTPVTMHVVLRGLIRYQYTVT